jgi:hypothetical protein
MKAQTGSRGIAVLFLEPWCWIGLGGQRHALAAVPRERPGTHCIAWWVGPRAILYSEENLAPTGIRTPDCPAGSKSL